MNFDILSTFKRLIIIITEVLLASVCRYNFIKCIVFSYFVCQEYANFWIAFIMSFPLIFRITHSV